MADDVQHHLLKVTFVKITIYKLGIKIQEYLLSIWLPESYKFCILKFLLDQWRLSLWILTCYYGVLLGFIVVII